MKNKHKPTKELLVFCNHNAFFIVIGAFLDVTVLLFVVLFVLLNKVLTFKKPKTILLFVHLIVLLHKYL